MTTERPRETQSQTKDAFSFKWAQTHTYSSPAMRAEWRRWLLEKYFDGDEEGPARFLGSGKRLRILDAGCGAGISALLLFGDLLRDHAYVGVDISDAVVEAERNFQAAGIPGQFVQADVSEIPASLGDFDVIFSEGVLHHTDSVQQALAQLSSRLNPEGRIAFYAYARKAPIREFTDDYIRGALSDMSDEQAWEALMPLTRLGQLLGDLGVEVHLDEGVDLLGIPAGSHDLQRLFYYSICKAYYRPDYSLDEMNHINFDWFRPLNCWRHTPREVSEFVDAAGLALTRLHVEPSGVTVIAMKPINSERNQE
jgi:arsenite methyltransferase